MKSRVLALAISLSSVVLMLSPASHAATLKFGAPLSGANEMPPTTSQGTGVVTVILDTTAQTLEISGSFNNLTSTTSAAHIHCCQMTPGVGNVGVATVQPTFTGFPLGVTTGNFDGTLDLTMASSYNSGFLAMFAGVPQAEAALISGLENGQTYFNIHTLACQPPSAGCGFPGGEIRGELASVPLPAALPLFATGLGALGLLSWRRKRRA